MARFALSRILQAIPTMFIVSMLVFGLIRMAPGDPAAMQMGREAAKPENLPRLEALREEMGLTKPIPVQYLYWIQDLAQGDFGDSLKNKRPTIDLFLQKLPATLELILGATLFALLLSVPLGILAAVRRGSMVDRVSMGFVSAGLAVPGFWLGLTLILLFSVRLKWLPASGYVPFSEDPIENLKRLILPSITLGTYLAATLMRFLRSDMIQVLGADYIRTARAKGLREKSVIMRHAMKNALVPVLTIAGLEIGALLGGAVIIEQLFGWSGVGWLTVQAIFDRDYPLVQTSVLFVTIGLIFVNLLTDIAYGFLNPRMRVS
ncbi:MAG: ABC transporter permease [Thermomicrobiales bacterium]|nr:ABC transporter permease [Thermomicrobiales bacterium]MCO5220594.1 ABC transporter permease [Thermomicrobiales bacterium]